MRVAARVAVVASHAHGSFGADVEKNTVTMSNTRTTPTWSLIRDHSRSSALTVRCGLDRPLPTGRAYPLCACDARRHRRRVSGSTLRRA